MELLEKYLQAVRFFLPRRNQDDIVRELSENILSQVEDQEEELGRPLTEDEQADVLRRHGHPMLVAGRYRQHQQLIGPVFFPMYLFTLKLGLGVALIVTVVVAAASAVLQGDVVRHLFRGLVSYPGRALMVVAWTTVVFGVLDFAQAKLKLTHNWDPRALPKLVRHDRRMSRWNSLLECLATVAAIVWLLLLPRAPYLIMGPAAAIFDAAPIWSALYLPMIGVTAATTVLSFVNFIRPFWTPARSLTRIAINASAGVIFVVLLRAGPWVSATPELLLQGGSSAERITGIANTGIEIGLILAFIVTLVEIAREAHRWLSRRRLLSAGNSDAAHAAR